MIIPEDILQNQLCSQCQKYLSVGPIKVYPNREVKCGRCIEDNDLGVESHLYHALVKDIMFPCINRYDGCSTVLPMSKMARHENDCYTETYDCLLCYEFKGAAYDLNLHCLKYHKTETLENSEILIDLDKPYQNDVFFYSKGTRLFFIYCTYEADFERLTLDLMFIGKRYTGSINYSIRMYSTEKKLKYKSYKPSSCSVTEKKLRARVVVNMKSIRFPKKLAICQFLIHEEPEFTYVENIPVIDSSFDTCILRCAFKNVHMLDFEKSVLFPAVYYFKDIKWRVSIKRKLSLTDYRRKFGVFLQWDKYNSDDMVESCKVSATFSILSSYLRKKLSKSFVKREYNFNYQSHGLMLADWNYIMDPEDGFVEDDCINIEVKMKIYLDSKKKVKCNDCNKNCIYCN